MDIILAILTVISLTITGSIAQEDCPERDPILTCERSCTPETGCRKAGRQCECAGECGWSCIRQGCQSLSAPDNGSVTIDPDDRSIGSTATYTCNYGYILQGTSVRTCQENKTWSEGDEVSCECIRNNDEVNRLGRACARPCPDDGICLRARHSCICDGICGKSCIPLGEENYCDTSLLSTDHATFTVDPETAEFGSIARYTCAGGFSSSGGDIERTCTGGGGWNGSALVCRPDRGNACYDPPDVENGSHNGSKEYYWEREVLLYTCDEGYYRSGSLPPLLRCQQRGDTLVWGNFDTTCLIKSCGHPGTIANGRIEGSVYSFRSSVTYVCDIGYRIQGLETIYCQADGQWSRSPPQCNPIPESQQCTIQDSSDAQWVRGRGCIAGQKQFSGCELTYTCNEEGYVPANTGVVYVCLGPAWIQREEPLCEEQELCRGMPQDPPNGQWVTGSNCQDDGQDQFPAGCQLSYTCNDGYVPVNRDVVYVCSGSAWDLREEEEPSCIPVFISEDSCDNSDLPGDLQKEKSDDRTENYSWLKVGCKNGFKLLGGFYLRCKNGRWRGNVHCKEN